MDDRQKLMRFAWLSIATAVFTITLKYSAYMLTGSVGLLSDALESGINLITAVVALIVLFVAAQPPDDEHAFGHAKAEYFAGGLEGFMILVAGMVIIFTAVSRLLAPEPIAQIGMGVFISIVASVGNLGTAVLLKRAGQKHRSLTLTAESHHLMTDVWTSGGVILGIVLVGFTGWVRLDALIAIVVAINIMVTGVKLLKMSMNGLMDSALPACEIEQIQEILDSYRFRGIDYHALRTRQSGAQRFLTLHVQTPGEWSVQKGHALIEEIEADIIRHFAPIALIIHLEPLEDPVSWDDIPLNRTIRHGSN